MRMLRFSLAVAGMAALVAIAVGVAVMQDGGEDATPFEPQAACRGDIIATQTREVVHGIVLAIGEAHYGPPLNDATVIEIEVTQRVAPPDAAPWPEVGAVFQVFTHEIAPDEASVGDCLAVAGEVRGFTCGLACDAAGFVAEEVSFVPRSPVPEGEFACAGAATASARLFSVYGVVLEVEANVFDSSGDFEYTMVEVEVTDAAGLPHTQQLAPIVGAALRVYVRGLDADAVAPGDCVSTIGRSGMFACGPACDAAGFTSEELRLVRRFDAGWAPFVCGLRLPSETPHFALYGVVREIDRRVWESIERDDVAMVRVDVRKMRHGTPSAYWTPVPSRPLDVMTTQAEAAGLQPGDCVYVRGEHRAIDCGPACDAVGFWSNDIDVQGDEP